MPIKNKVCDSSQDNLKWWLILLVNKLLHVEINMTWNLSFRFFYLMKKKLIVAGSAFYQIWLVLISENSFFFSWNKV